MERRKNIEKSLLARGYSMSSVLCNSAKPSPVRHLAPQLLLQFAVLAPLVLAAILLEGKESSL